MPSFFSSTPPPANGRPRHRSRAAHPLVWSLRFWFWIFTVVVSACAGVSVGAFFGFLSKQSPIPELEYYDPPQVTRVFEREGREVVATFFDEKREVVSQAEIPALLKNAFIAVEDERFYRHFGVDLKGVGRALFANLRRGALRQGASTITQQLSRNILPSKVGRERSLGRKIREALAAFLIEQRYSKDQILEFYLNHIFLGHNSYGVQSAARTYFGKDVRDLTVSECAALAAIPRSPTRVNPITSPSELKQRRNLILDNMAAQGLLDAETARLAKAEDVVSSRTTQPRVRHPYFISDHLRRAIAEETEADEDLLSRGGYHVYASISVPFQKIVEEELAKGLPEVEKQWQQRKYIRNAECRLYEERRQIRKKHGDVLPRKGQQRLMRIAETREDGVVVAIEEEIQPGRTVRYEGFAPLRKETEEVVRADGSRETVWTGRYLKPWYFPESVLKTGEYIDVFIHDVNEQTKELKVSLFDTTRVQGAAVLLDVKTGQILALAGGADYYDQQNKGMWNRATFEPGRQPGSAFKPLLYAAALERGYTPGSVIMDDRIEFRWAGSAPYIPRNYEREYGGPTTLLKALEHSNNVVTIKLYYALGPQRQTVYEKFDILRPKPTWRISPGLATCLGSLDVTPLSLAAAYLPFARNGVIAEPTCVLRVADLNNATAARKRRARERLTISPQNAYLTTHMLVRAVREGTGKRTIGDYFDWAQTPEIAGKTGTTNNCVDAWFVGYTPELVLAVRVGFDQVRPMGPGMTGGRVAAPVWRAMMERILATRSDWKMRFDVPEDIVFRDISSRTGLLASAGRLHGDETLLRGVPFIKGTEPTEMSRGYEGFPYWKHQRPDSDYLKDPSRIPRDLLARWEAEQAARRETAPAEPVLPQREWTEEEIFLEDDLELESAVPGDFPPEEAEPSHWIPVPAPSPQNLLELPPL